MFFTENIPYTDHNMKHFSSSIDILYYSYKYKYEEGIKINFIYDKSTR